MVALPWLHIRDRQKVYTSLFSTHNTSMSKCMSSNESLMLDAVEIKTLYTLSPMSDIDLNLCV